VVQFGEFYFGASTKRICEGSLVRLIRKIKNMYAGSGNLVGISRAQRGDNLTSMI
jgi:hypothetical protein